MKKIIALLTLLSVLFCGCGGKGISARELAAGQPWETPVSFTPPASEAPVMALALDLLRQTHEPDSNTLLSPLSILTALSMTANGAEGNTLAQMDAVLGLDRESRNGSLGLLLNTLNDSKSAQVEVANSIWFREHPDFTVREEFLQINEAYYRASVFEAPFDLSTRNDINRWVEEKTDGQIRDILDQVPENAMIYLVNALVFEGEWPEAYRENAVRDREFTGEAGNVQSVEMMYSQEADFLETDLATGFVKYYKGGEYGFAALLPREDTTVSQLLASLTAEDLSRILKEPQKITVHTGIPKFTADYDIELSQVLKSLGMTDAFDYRVSDFSGIGAAPEENNLYIGRVLHKTHIQVAEQGTKAGAATVVEMPTGAPMEMETRTVILDRPFVYLIFHVETGQPLFVGTLMEP